MKTQNQNFKISVIIPCFNAEKNLRRCIDSVINQDCGFENIELILYDDASTDNTKKIILEYAEIFPNIIPLFNKINQGPGVGRNKGIYASSADFIMFLDSDDEYDKSICQRFLNEIINGWDIVSCNYIHKDEIDSYETKNKITIGVKEDNKTIIESDNLVYFNELIVWNKIFKKSVLIDNNIEFPPIYNGEDEIFLRRLFIHAKNLVYLDDFFGYIKHQQLGSISDSMSVNDLNFLIRLCECIEEIYEDITVDLPQILQPRVYMLVSSLYMYNITKNSDKHNLYLFLDKLCKFEKRISFDKTLGFLADVPNYLIKKRKFKLTILYCSMLFTIRKSNFILKSYRLYLKIRNGV